MVVERLLQRVEAAVRGEPLDGPQLGTVGLHCKGGARAGRLPVEQDRAGAADAVFAPCMRPGKSQVLPEEIDKQLARLATAAIGLAVHGQGNLDGIIHVGTPRFGGPRVAARVLQNIRGEGGEDQQLFTDLTERELDVLKLIANGMTNSQIAEELVITENTVKGHVSNILSKLHLVDRTQAAVYAWQRGIVRRDLPE